MSVAYTQKKSFDFQEDEIMHRSWIHKFYFYNWKYFTTSRSIYETNYWNGMELNLVLYSIFHTTSISIAFWKCKNVTTIGNWISHYTSKGRWYKPEFRDVLYGFREEDIFQVILHKAHVIFMFDLSCNQGDKRPWV